MHDVLDRVVEVVDPEAGSYQFQYDQTGQLLRFLEPSGATTSYAYDGVGRLVSITYPDSTFEGYGWDGAGNLVEYTDNAGREFSFHYDAAERLTEIRYESLVSSKTISFSLDDSGNVASITERNLDEVSYLRDALGRIQTEQFVPGSGSASPAWKHRMAYDNGSNRNILIEEHDVYGVGEFGTALYGSVFWEIPTSGFDENQRLVEFRNAEALPTTMSYDEEGRRTGITYPNGALGAAAYDYVGRLLSLAYATGEAPAFLGLDYAYDANSNRTAMVAGADTFAYRYDRNSRLVGESRNCLSLRSSSELKKCNLTRVENNFEDNRLQLLSWDDSLMGESINMDRWRPVFPPRQLVTSENVETRGYEIRPNQGLQIAFPRGSSYQVGENPTVYPKGYQTLTYSGEGGVAAVNHPFTAGLEHRLTLVGDFDVEVELENVEILLEQCFVALRVQYTPLEIDPTVRMEVTYGRHGYASGITGSNGGLLGVRTRSKRPTVAQDFTPAATDTPEPGIPTQLRIKRVSGLITAQYVTATSGPHDLDPSNFTSTSELYLSLVMVNASGIYSCATFKNFARTDRANQFASSGTLVSQIYDTGRSGTAFDKLSWTGDMPSTGKYGSGLYNSSQYSAPLYGEAHYDLDEYGTGYGVLREGIDRYDSVALKFQVYASDDLEDMLSPTYVGPDASSYYSDSRGEELTVTGRYFRLKGYLAASTQQVATPMLPGVRVTYAGGDGANSWAETLFDYDLNGNMTSREDLTAAGARFEQRSYNNLNQLTASSVSMNATPTESWTFTHDANGRMTGKTDGTNTWTYTWDPDEPRLWPDPEILIQEL